MDARRIVIFTAVETEAAAIRRALKDSGRVVAIGIGGGRLPALAGAESPEVVILAGLAGALDPELRAADLVVDGLPDEFRPSLPCRRGRIVSSDRIIATPAAKQELAQSSGAIAVEMEGDAVRRAIAAMPEPPRFIHLRAILDRAGETLPPFLAGFVDRDGRTRGVAVARHVIRHPTSIATLWRIGRSTKLALRSLATVTAELVEHLSRTTDHDGSGASATMIRSSER